VWTAWFEAVLWKSADVARAVSEGMYHPGCDVKRVVNGDVMLVLSVLSHSANSRCGRTLFVAIGTFTGWLTVSDEALSHLPHMKMVKKKEGFLG
jgi:hypothetical protein